MNSEPIDMSCLEPKEQNNDNDNTFSNNFGDPTPGDDAISDMGDYHIDRTEEIAEQAQPHLRPEFEKIFKMERVVRKPEQENSNEHDIVHITEEVSFTGAIDVGYQVQPSGISTSISNIEDNSKVFEVFKGKKTPKFIQKVILLLTCLEMSFQVSD